MTEAQFWSEARKRRNQIFVCLIAWVPFGVVIAIVCHALFGRNGIYSVYPALVAWFVTGYWLLRRLGKLACPRCCRPAFGHPYFFMRHARCQSCGFRYEKKVPPTEPSRKSR